VLPQGRIEYLGVDQFLDVHASLNHKEQSLINTVSKLDFIRQDQQCFNEGFNTEDGVGVEAVVNRIVA